MSEEPTGMRSRGRTPRRLETLLVAGVLLVGAAPSLAQDGDEAGVRYKKKTVINFEDDTIEGDLKTPDGQYLEVRARMRHRSLIRIRTEFRREVLGSIADL